MEEIFNIQALVYVVVGMLVFGVANIDDITNNTRTSSQWWQYSLFTVIAILVGICVCAVLDASRGWYWITSIACGMLGGVVLSKIDTRKEEIGDSAVDKIKSTITSADITSIINSKRINSGTPLIEQSNITEQQTVDSSNTFIDPEQSPYNPFEDENN